MRILKILVGCVVALGLGNAAIAQDDEDKEKDKPALSSPTFNAFELRNIGPAFMSGRIADIQIVQDDPATWYVGVASGGVWKTENAGTTWKSVFDGQGAYSIGTVALDPSDPSRVYVGTGENNGGRHIGYGDGIYRSDDA
ncbi:MAG: glycosyl hydrolase, partial [Pseudomonadota bacterium]